MSAQFLGKATLTIPGPGLTPTGALTTSGATAGNATSIALTAATTLVGTINKGDTFVISGVTYTATAAATAGANVVTVPVTPAAPGGGIPGGTTWSAYAVTAYSDPIILGPSAPTAALAGNLALLGVTALLDGSPPAGTSLELWLYDVTAADPTLVANYRFAQTLITAVGAITVPLASWPAAMIRAKGTGTTGTAVVLYSAD